PIMIWRVIPRVVSFEICQLYTAVGTVAKSIPAHTIAANLELSDFSGLNDLCSLFLILTQRYR
ncbi:hypothetical protein ACC699_39650, partial [Rhizobium ruizarguesonis]